MAHPALLMMRRHRHSSHLELVMRVLLQERHLERYRRPHRCSRWDSRHRPALHPGSACSSRLRARLHSFAPARHRKGPAVQALCQEQDLSLAWGSRTAKLGRSPPWLARRRLDPQPPHWLHFVQGDRILIHRQSLLERMDHL